MFLLGACLAITTETIQTKISTDSGSIGIRRNFRPYSQIKAFVCTCLFTDVLAMEVNPVAIKAAAEPAIAANQISRAQAITGFYLTS